jgi:hypothetical protein
VHHRLDPSLAGAFIDGGVSHRLLGVRLRPFSLWHLLLLQTLDSPFLRKGQVGLHDLRTAIGICRLRFGQSRVRRPSLGLVLLCRKGAFHDAVCDFLSYTGGYLYKPDYSIVPSKYSTPGKVSGAPEIFRLASDVIGWSHWTEDHVWNMAPGRAQWYRSSALRAIGADVDFVSQADRDFEAAMKAAGLKPKQKTNG